MEETPNNENVVSLTKEELEKNLNHYRNVVNCLGANVPIQCLCLPKKVENALIKDGFIRIYDLLYRDFREVKGIGTENFDLISGRLDEFGSVGL
jgi:hypothetical protein